MTKINHIKILSSATVLSILSLLMAISGQPAEAAFPGTNGKILFERYGATRTMNSNGSNLQTLGPVFGRRLISTLDPTWSADGAKIAFVGPVSDQPLGRNEEIFKMNADGSDVRWLTSNATNDYLPAWSPDGRQIVFARPQQVVNPRDANLDIWVLNADGSGQRPLASSPYHETDPAWSPDGRRIAYMRSGELWVMNADGTNQSRLPVTVANGREPNWSPDGRRIAFSEQRAYQQAEIAVMNADGSAKTFLTDNPTFDDLDPAFSPDGRYIVFQSCTIRRLDTTQSTCRIRKMNSDGSSQVDLTTPPTGTLDRTPDWQPLLAFRLDAIPITVTFPGIFRVSGRFIYGGIRTSGRQLTLWEQPADLSKDFTPVPGAETTTDKDGYFSFEKIAPQKNTNYQVRFSGDPEAGAESAMSPIKPVDVRVLVSLELSADRLRLGKTLLVSGGVQPSHEEREVVLTIKRDGKKVATKSAALDESSRYSLTYDPPKAGDYSVVARFSGDDDHTPNTSPKRTFRVVR